MSLTRATPEPPPTAPLWMSRWLLFAGVYNLLWGAAMVLFPIASLRLLGVTPASTELWPQLWACIGMVIGVYGIGYLLAAKDPARHWPIVLVGLLGKIFGPIGFLDAALRHQLPWSMGWTILTNDLLWWAPFTMILWHAARVNQPLPPPGAVPLATALDTLRDQHGRTLRSLTDAGPTLVVLLRHAGCTFCREALAELAAKRAAIHAAGSNLAVIGMSPSSVDLAAHAVRFGLRDAACFADPDRLAYRALELGRGTLLQLFGPRVVIRGLLAALRGYRVGRLEGDGFQMPGAFLIHRGSVLRSFRHRTAADRPDYQDLSCPTNP